MTEIAGLVVRILGARYFVPLESVGFVAPIRKVRGGMLVMPKGDLPLAGPPPSETGATQVVAVRAGSGFVAIAVEAVELANSAGARRARPLAELDSALGSAEASPGVS